MPTREIHNSLAPEVAFNTQAITTDTTTAGNTIDLQGKGAYEFYILSGTLTDGTYTPALFEDDNSDMSTESAVADADLTNLESTAVFASTDDNEVKRIGYIGSKRYIRLKIVSASTSSGGTIGAVGIAGNLDNEPAAANA